MGKLDEDLPDDALEYDGVYSMQDEDRYPISEGFVRDVRKIMRPTQIDISESRLPPIFFFSTRGP